LRATHQGVPRDNLFLQVQYIGKEVTDRLHIAEKELGRKHWRKKKAGWAPPTIELDLFVAWWAMPTLHCFFLTHSLFPHFVIAGLALERRRRTLPYLVVDSPPLDIRFPFSLYSTRPKARSNQNQIKISLSWKRGWGRELNTFLFCKAWLLIA
jgi:hypothetical protein